MVLIGRQEALLTYKENQSLDALICLLFEPTQEVNVPSRLSKTEDVVITLLASVRNKDKVLFEKAMAVLERRKVSEQTEWIHDDLAVFSMIVSNLHHGGHAEIIKKGIQARMNSSDQQSLDVSMSLSALNDGLTTAPILSILIVGQELAGKTESARKEILQQAFKQSEQMELNEQISPFLRLLGEKTASMAVSMCVDDSFSSHYAMMKFQRSFDTRVRLFSYLIFTVILVGLTGGWIFLAWLYLFGNTEQASYVEKLFSMGIVVMPISILMFRAKILGSIRSLFYRLFGGGHWLKFEREQQ